MSPLGAYSFLPYLRQGIANTITAVDFDPSVRLRATTHVNVQIAGDGVDGGMLTDAVSRDVALFGPGDIVGIESRAIVRTEPRHWATDFESSYLAHVEFYDEDFPWRYMPAAANAGTHRLRPWIALVVLTEDEFDEPRNVRHRPLPYIAVKDLAVLPIAEQLWASAHVHVNGSLAGSATEFRSTDMAAVMPRLDGLLGANADLAFSRLLSLRRLDANKAYHAFVVPVFETGRLAGLGLEPSDSPNATFSAWALYPAGTRAEPQNLPYYHRWYFRTGQLGDFEYLVRLLKAKAVDPRVGTRDMDVRKPGLNIPGITDPTLGGILKLGGALRVPLISYTPEQLAEVLKYEHWAEPYPVLFQRALASFINLADDYSAASAQDAHSRPGFEIPLDGDQDPLIAPPLYGRWHGLTERLLRDRAQNPVANDRNWVHELNLDPRFRVPAGFGTRVIQDQQEQLMNAAWAQVGDVLEANRRIRLAQLARETSFIWFYRHLLPLYDVNPEQALRLTAPVHARTMAGGVTVKHVFSRSRVPAVLNGVGMRRVLRPGGRLLRGTAFSGTVRPTNLLQRINSVAIDAAPPKGRPTGFHTVDDAVHAVAIDDVASPESALLLRYPLLPNVVLAASTLLLWSAIWRRRHGWEAGTALILSLALFRYYQRLTKPSPGLVVLNSAEEAHQTPASIAALPRSPDFVLSKPGSGYTPTPGATDSSQAARYKSAISDTATLLVESTRVARVLPRTSLNFAAISQAATEQLLPDRTIPKRLLSAIVIPARLRTRLLDSLRQVMAYPVIDVPMYKPLSDLSSELFLPNINLIDQNSITLLETNQKFIEAYMAGLNHEFARELLWREYPTDMRGSSFRQFWDASGFLPPAGIAPDTLREQLRDIPPLHFWTATSKLGDHDARERPGEAEEEIVVVIRGDLLKRYPTAVIYAQRARWARKADGSIDASQPREFDEPGTPAEEANPPRSKVRTPLYEAKVDPDIYFFGLDLTAAAARGGTGEHPDDDPGWFIVIKERPGEPRFGFDLERQPVRETWNDLAWDDVQPGGGPGQSLRFDSSTPTIVLNAIPPASEPDKRAQHDADVSFAWSQNMSSAEAAYILFQAPVLIGIHASEMLPKPEMAGG